MHGELLSKELKNKMKPGEQSTYFGICQIPTHLIRLNFITKITFCEE